MSLLLDRTILAILTFILLFASMYLSIDNFFEASYLWRHNFQRTDLRHRGWFMWLASLSLLTAVVTNHWLNPVHPDADAHSLSLQDMVAVLVAFGLIYVTLRLALVIGHRYSSLLTGVTLTGAICIVHFGADTGTDDPYIHDPSHWVALALYTLVLYGLVSLTLYILKLGHLSNTVRSASATWVLSLAIVGYHVMTSYQTREVVVQTFRSHSFTLWIQDVHLSAVAQAISGVSILLIMLNALVNRYLHRRQRAISEDISEALTRNQGLVFMLVPSGKQFVFTICDGDLLYKMGVSPERALNRPLEAVFHDEEQMLEWQRYCETALAGEDVVFEFEVRGIQFLTSIRPVSRDGKAVAVVGSCIETTSLFRARQVISDIGQKYRLIVENTSDLILILSPSGKIQFTSTSSESLLGFTYKELRGTMAASLLPGEERVKALKEFRTMIHGRQPITLDHGLNHRDGSLREFETRLVPVYATDGQIESVVVVGRDITERKRNEEMLRRSENLSVLGQLAAGMAHEIRNPLTSIRGFVQLLDEQQKSNPYWPIILQETRQIEEIVTEFLSLAKPQAVDQMLLDLSQILRDVQMLVSPQAILNNTKLQLSAGEALWIMGVPHQLKQVFTNIIKNAIEAIDGGGEIRIVLTQYENHAKVLITDNGPGIHPAILDRLGEPFYSTKSRGTGLGLLISNKIVQEHSGHLHISSELDKGTSVELQFPLADVTPPEVVHYS